MVVVVAGAFGYNYWHTEQNVQGENAMFKAVDYWEADSLNKAMKGDGKHPGLAKVASEYSGTKAGNLANFYAGVASLKEGKFQEAYNYLDKFSSNDYLVQSRAYSLMGDAKLELNQPKEAAELYAKAADHNENPLLFAGLRAEAGHCPGSRQGQRRRAESLRPHSGQLRDFAGNWRSPPAQSCARAVAPRKNVRPQRRFPTTESAVAI